MKERRAQVERNNRITKKKIKVEIKRRMHNEAAVKFYSLFVGCNPKGSCLGEPLV
jgi:hypothetical protein